MAYNAQILLSENSREKLALLQKIILTQVTGPLWECPSDSLHISITPFLSVREDYAGRKQELWKQNRADWIKKLRASVHEIRNWTVHYRALRITEMAIIAVAHDEGVTNRVRCQLNLQESKGWDLVHTTLFRFSSNYEVTASDEEKIRAVRIEILEKVMDVVIVKETKYPSLVSAVLERIPVARPQSKPRPKQSPQPTRPTGG